VLVFTLGLQCILGNKQQLEIKFIICLVLYILIGMSTSVLLLHGLPNQDKIKAKVMEFSYRKSAYITDLAYKILKIKFH
jgi:hypothetical protein